MISEGDVIAGKYTARMNHPCANPMFPVPPTGKEVAFKASNFLRVKNGKIVEDAERKVFFTRQHSLYDKKSMLE